MRTTYAGRIKDLLPSLNRLLDNQFGIVDKLKAVQYRLMLASDFVEELYLVLGRSVAGVESSMGNAD